MTGPNIVLYGFLLCILCGNRIAAQLDLCTNGVIESIYDGWCNENNNNEECLYDGGDCCPCSCTNGLTYTCGINGFFCRDPSSGCVDPHIDMYPACTDGNIPDIQDGQCDESNNNKRCGFDGGDCCECTRIGEGSSSTFSLCVDPSAACFDPAAVALQSNCTSGYIPSIGNGWCDVENNDEGCFYDGGDCCDCTGVDDGSSSTFSLCVDPSATCFDPTAAALLSNCTGAYIPSIGNGSCDVENNNEGCLYDGGDCCECTHNGNGSSSSFLLCVDPSASCFNLAAVALQSNCTDGYIPSISDGRCDLKNNNEGCLFDGGDCCECTRNGNGSSSSFSLCVDPSASCFDLTAVALQSNCTDGYIPSFRDGRCDLENNNEGCLFDGGDCCECTRIGNESSSSFSLCVDPSASCFYPPAVTLQSNCTDGSISEIGNGWCDAENNNEACLYDGGDCCFCTCTHLDCGIGDFECVDPDVVNLEPYICVELPPTHTPCPPGIQREWVVENTSGARALAEAVRCPGESFSVSWIGDVVVVETISVAHGTVLNITSEVSSTIIGDGEIRLLTVVNASLHLRNVIMVNGSAIFGGAIAASRSRLTFQRVTFDGNNAIGGGALSLSKGTIASFGEDVTFLNNTAVHGGAIYVMGGSNVSWTGPTMFSGNTATSGNGGALYAGNGSSVTWLAETQFVSNSAGGYGGGVFIESASNAVWAGTSHFLANAAMSCGGVCILDGSTVVWSAESGFFANSADLVGGAAVVAFGGTATWSAKSVFHANRAGIDGGGVVLYKSTGAWSAPSFFYANIAEDNTGGALFLADSTGIWSAESTLSANSAGNHGGALLLALGSSATWSAVSVFSANNAQSDGGAVFARGNVTLSWKSDAQFIDNTASNGGAIFVREGATAEFAGSTEFTFNKAKSDGGAVGSRAFGSVVSSAALEEGSVITSKGAISFVNNTCGANGGGMAIVQSLVALFEGDKPTFFHNSAGVSGGAVFVAGIGIGIVMRNAIFVGNVAQTGGGVRVTGSGTTVTINEKKEQVSNPSTFDGCIFVGNSAFGTGGAVDSASGQDLFNRTIFLDNKARVGGALRLAGKASVVNCSFIENVSDLSGGPAVSNVGYISNVSNSYFRGNVFDCEAEMFLDFKPGDMLSTICDGCPDTCVGCFFEEKQSSPTCTSLSEAGIEHATSIGGRTTMEGLYIHKGYWRATNTSTNVNKCFNSKACSGGITGTFDYCLSGYEGPYCSVCSKNHVPSLSSTCRECFDSAVVILIAIVFTILVAAVALAIFSYLMSVKAVNAGGGIMDCVTQRIPMHSVKIIIVVWQILTQFTSVATVTFPSVYQTLLDGVDFFNFDFTWIVSAGCFLEIDFHDRLLWTTTTPVVVMGLLCGTYAFAIHRNRDEPETALRNIRERHRSMALLVAFLVYSSVSSVVFQTFACEDLDDGKRYLRADFTIECDSPKHRAFQVYAGLMVMIYPVGIPALYAVLLFGNRHVLRDEQGRGESAVASLTSDLWKPYKPHRFYYEVIECGRRILLAGAVVFIYPNTAAQIAVTLAIATVFIFVSEAMAPYHSQWDAWISRSGHAIVFVTIYVALLLKVDVSGENDSSQKTFEVVIVAGHGCMILAVVVEAMIMALLVRARRHREDPSPRCRRSPNNPCTIQASLVEEDTSGKTEL